MVVSRVNWVWAEINLHFGGLSETGVHFFSQNRGTGFDREHVRTLCFRDGGDYPLTDTVTYEDLKTRWGERVTHIEVPEWYAREKGLSFEE
jgi:hypothetical protein